MPTLYESQEMTHNPPPLNTHSCKKYKKHTCTHANTDTHLALFSSTDREEYVQAALLMHIYTEHTLTHLLSGRSLKVIVCECVSVCPPVHVHACVKVTSSEADHLSMLCTDCWIDIENTWTSSLTTTINRTIPASKTQ